MRHRRKGRVLGRSPSHQRAMLRNLASSLVLTEREFEPGEPGAPKVPGRIVTTVAKAKEVRPAGGTMYYDSEARAAGGTSS